MSRMKKGEPGSEAASRRWHETMLAKYGEEGLREMMRKNGAKGGRNGHEGKGFAANPELARKAGSKGGKISRRGPGKKTTATKKVATKREEFTKLTFVKSTLFHTVYWNENTGELIKIRKFWR